MARKRKRRKKLDLAVGREISETFVVDGAPPVGFPKEVEARVELVCPFCGGRVVVAAEAVMHSLPMCEKYIDEEPLMFLRNARFKLMGRRPGDEEHPAAGPKDDGRGN